MVQDSGPITIWANLETADVLSGEIHIAAGSVEEDEADEYSGRVTSVLPGGNLTFELEAIPKRLGERHAWRIRVTGLADVALGTFEILENLDDENIAVERDDPKDPDDPDDE